MATSYITLFNVGFKYEDNLQIENISDYLESHNVHDYFQAMYIKIEKLFKLVVPVEQASSVRGSVNYVSIKNSDDVMIYYFYVKGSKWLSSKALELDLEIDSVNTFNKQIYNNITNKTHIMREHADRFVSVINPSSQSFNAIRKVDRVDEGLNDINLIKYSSDKIANNLNKWYLVYRNDIETGVGCFFYPDSDLPFGTFAGSFTFDISSLETGKYYCIGFNENASNTSYTIRYNFPGESGTKTGTLGSNKFITFVKNGARATCYIGTASADGVITWQETGSYNYVQATSITFNNLYSYRTINRLTTNLYYPISEGLKTTVSDGSKTYAVGINSLDRTLSDLIKIIELPYPPFNLTMSGDIYNVPEGVEFNNGLLKLSDLNTELSHKILENSNITELNCTIPSNQDRLYRGDNLIEYESKLYNSSFYSLKYVYDSFSKTVRLEDFKTNTFYETDLSITFVQSNTINSNLLFKFDYGTPYIEIEDFENYLLCSRNNEYPIYNSEYLNYIRNGYRYDVKSKNANLATGWLGLGVQAAGVGGALASGVALPIAAAVVAGLANSLINNINKTMQSEIGLEKKLNESKAQANSIQASDDLNLMNYYNEGHKLRKIIYKPTDMMQNALFELFRLCGYKRDYYAIPDLTTRKHYNFIQAELDLKEDSTLLKFKDHIKAKYLEGVTYIHDNATLYGDEDDNRWDIERVLPNFEKWLY